MNTETNDKDELKKESTETKTKTRKRGQPHASVKRTKHLIVLLTPVERLLIDAKAREAAMTASEWFRQAAKNAKVERRLTAEDLGILHMLAALANNLDQLAKMAHAEGLFSIHQTCREILSEIQKTLNYLNRHDRKSNDR